MRNSPAYTRVGSVMSEAARESFMDGWQIMMLIVSALAVFTACIAFRFIPPHHMPQDDADG